MKEIITNKNTIDNILERGVIADILPAKKDLYTALTSGKHLTFYLGIDATGSSLHLGHAQNIMLLEDFRKLGHKAVLLIGDFTAQIGDPSEKETTRMQLTKEEVDKNIKSLVSQIKPILNFEDTKNPAQLAQNSQWLSALTFTDVVHLAGHFTVQQFVERDMFQKRLSNKNPIYLHEFLYPLMQGYDSVALNTDVEIGGTDQTFNMLAGRTLLKRLANKEKVVVVTHLIQNPKTGELMSKSAGTGVMLGGGPRDLFGQIMAQPDEMIPILLERVTRLPLEEVQKLREEARGGGGEARDAKLTLAQKIVALHYSEKEAEEARESFIKVFSKGEGPKEVPQKVVPYVKEKLYKIITDTNLASSSSEARRLVKDGAVEIDGKKITDPHAEISLKEERLLRVGKHRFARILTK